MDARLSFKFIVTSLVSNTGFHEISLVTVAHPLNSPWHPAPPRPSTRRGIPLIHPSSIISQLTKSYDWLEQYAERVVELQSTQSSAPWPVHISTPDEVEFNPHNPKPSSKFGSTPTPKALLHTQLNRNAVVTDAIMYGDLELFPRFHNKLSIHFSHFSPGSGTLCHSLSLSRSFVLLRSLQAHKN